MGRVLAAAAAALAGAQLANAELCPAQEKVSWTASSVPSEIKIVGADQVAVQLSYEEAESASLEVEVALKTTSPGSQDIFSLEDGVVTLDLTSTTAEVPDSAASRGSQSAAAQAAGMLSLAAVTGRENPVAGAALAAMGLVACVNGDEACTQSAAVVVRLPASLCLEGKAEDIYSVVPCAEETSIKALRTKMALDTSAVFDVTLSGVLTADFMEARKGFMLQMTTEEAAAAPAELANVSEGLYVYCSNSCPVGQAAEGDYVTITASTTVFNEQFGVQVNFMQLNKVETCETKTAIVNEVSGIALCKPVNVVTFTFPHASHDGFIQIDGMLVNIDNELTVTSNYDLKYGSLVLSSAGLLRAPTMVVPAGDEAEALSEQNAARMIKLDDSSSAACPSSGFPAVGGENSTVAGDVFTSNTFQATAVIGIDYSDWSLLPTKAGLEYVPDKVINGERYETFPEDYPVNDASTGALRISSLNVLNYFTELGCSACRGADTEEEFARQKIKTFNSIKYLDAAVFGLQELQNDGGVTLNEFVTSLNEFLGTPGKYAAVETGAVGTDAITCAIIYQPAFVEPVGDFQVLEYEALGANGFSRPSIAQSFKVAGASETGDVFTVVNSHLKSKSSQCDEDISGADYGVRVFGEGNCGAVRLEHVKQLITWLSTDPTGVNSNLVALLGDLNSHRFDRSVVQLVTVGEFESLADSIPDAFSYQFSGEWSTLDYFMASEELSTKCGNTLEWHINSIESLLLGYDAHSCSDAVETLFDATSPLRGSDHDPLIAVCNFAL